MEPDDGIKPLGAIHDTNSWGRFDLIVFPDGILGVTGTYLGVALRAGGIGTVGAGPGGLGTGAVAASGASIGAMRGKTFEGRRLEKILKRPRAVILSEDAKAFFIAGSDVTEIVLKKRWHGCSITVKTQLDPQGRVFEWKPALNNFRAVQKLLVSAFGSRLVAG